VTAFHIALGVALIAVNAVAGLYGAYAWWRRTTPRAFWPLLRIGQALVMVEALDGAFIAEQLRLASADTVLGQRGLEGRKDVEALPEAEQRQLVRDIVRREMGVMAASAIVVALLGVRAAGAL
jgi:hypothetical protein